jgi:putative component of toxin-antitoxin plasmid stabilization module
MFRRVAGAGHGGDKSNQAADIRKAIKLAKEL